jgi:hypothetical protein
VFLARAACIFAILQEQNLFEVLIMYPNRLPFPSARTFLPFFPLSNAAARPSFRSQAALRSSSMLAPAFTAKCFSNESGASKPMSFIEKAKLLGANAILGAMTHQGGFDSALQGMNIDRIDNGSCAASLVVTSNLANA